MNINKYLLVFTLFIFTSTFANAVTLKIATISPEGSSWMKSMRTAAKEIKTKTEDRVRLKFYTGGVMGSDKAVLKKIRFKQLHGGALTSNSLSSVYKNSQLYTLPMIFNNQDEVDFVRKKMDKKLLQGYDKNGYVVFGFAGGGFAYIMSKKPIRNIQDIRQNKVWIPSDDSSANEIVKAFDVSPIPLGLGDVLPSLQTGIIDTVAASPIGAIALQWHTQVKYILDLPTLYIYAFLAIDKKAFNKLTKPDQVVFRQTMAKAFSKIDQHNRENNQQALAALRSFGIQFSKLEQSEKNVWAQLAAKVGPNLVKQDRLSKNMFNELQSIIKSYREKKRLGK